MAIRLVRFCALSAFVIWLSSVSASAQTVLYYRFMPDVVRSTETQPVLLEVKIIGSATRVALDFDPAGSRPLVDLLDNGANGDRQAGDGIYSVNLTAAQVLQGLRADDVFRRFVGFTRLYQGTTLTSSINTFAQIHTPELPRVAIRQLAPDAQCSDYVVNIVWPAFFNNANTVTDDTGLARRFYQLFRDDYDMLNLVSTISYINNRHHVITRNDVSGIGLLPTNGSLNYGSTGRLIGYNVFPNAGLFDGANAAYQHEIGHQWVQHLTLPTFSASRAHWPYSSMATGIMGFSIPPTNQGGNYNCKLVIESGGIRLQPDNTAKVFTDIDLYLMGLLPADQVGEQILFTNQNDTAIQTCNNSLYTGPTTRFRASDIVAAFGARSPSVANSLKQIRLATIIVTPDKLLGEEAMAFYHYFSQRAEATQVTPIHDGFLKIAAKPFALSTGGRATLVTNLGVTKTAPLAAVTATSYAQGQLASESIAAAFGANLATEVRVASTIPLPTALAGTSLKVKDALGVERLAPLFFVSPAQVNFLVPAGTALGNATYTLTSDNGSISAGATTIAAISPGLFTFNADGQGVPAASALRVKADGTQSYESIARYDQATARWIATPINLGPEGEQVFLILYGSGLRGVSSLSGVTCTTGGLATQVLYAGAQGELVGLDQVNVGLPRNLISRGNVSLALMVDGKPTNIVQLTIQ